MPPPENRLLPPLDPIPNLPKPVKYAQSLFYMRGPEPIHNTLMYNQYGIIALSGGRLAPETINNIRTSVNKYLDTSKSFAIWRIDAPWQSVFKRAISKRRGGGLGNIHHYVTPVRAGRVIIEVGGCIDFEEVLYFLQPLSRRLPFFAMPVSAEILEQLRKEDEIIRSRNVNPLTYKRCIDKNLLNCKYDMSGWNDDLWYGRYQ